MSGFEGKVALVTGAARGIGRACVLELARRGADVAINDVRFMDEADSVAREVRAMSRRAIVAQGDVSDRRAMDALVNRTVEEMGRLDVLVANAGRNVRKPFLEMEPQDMEETLAVTLWGTFHVSQLAARQMVRQGRGGSIVFISSVHAVLAIPGSAAYNMAKAGINHLARTMATELTPHAIRVNIIEPGWIDTPGEHVSFSEQQLREAGAKLPLGRMGTAYEIARGAAFLASDDASYITGSTLRIDGGYVLPRLS
jgi:glucose 1-dehydrogenase